MRLEEADNAFEMFPNPASNSFMIKSVFTNDATANQQLEIEIRTISGSLVKRINIVETEPIDISLLPVGVYMVEIKRQGSPTIAKQLVKMK